MKLIFPTVLFLFFLNLSFGQKISVPLDTILLPDLNISVNEYDNFHTCVYENELYTLYYNGKIHNDSLNFKVFNLKDYTSRSFTIVVKELANEISIFKKWNVKGIKGFQVLSDDNFLVFYNSVVKKIDIKSGIDSTIESNQIYDFLDLKKELIFIDINLTGYELCMNNRIDKISFYKKGVGKNELVLLYEHPFFFTEAISIKPNKFWDTFSDKILITDIKGNISLLNNSFDLIDKFYSNDKPPITNKQMQKMRKKHKHYVNVMGQLSEVLWSESSYFMRDIHFFNDSTFFTYKKCQDTKDKFKQFKLDFYKIKNDKIYFIESKHEIFKVQKNFLFDKVNFPTHLASAQKILTSDSKLIKVIKYGSSINPVGLTNEEYNDSLEFSFSRGKANIEIQIFNVLEN